MKNKFVSTVFMLIMGGFITKILGFVIKIVYTRIITDTGVSLYALVMPTYSLLITIASMAMPLTVSKLVSEGKTRGIQVICSSIFIVLLVNVFLICFMLCFSRFLALHLLVNQEAYYLLLAATFTLPFISVSSILKGYFFGRQRMFPYTLSNILEQLVRLGLILVILPHFVQKSILAGVVVFILLNILAEFFSICFLLFFVPKKGVIHFSDIKPHLETLKDVLGLSLPTVSSRFIGNIGFFLEPIILTAILLWRGFSQEYILMEYGAYNGYTIALLSMPSFFVGAVSSALVPEISRYYEQKNKEMVKRRFYQALSVSFFIGLFFSVLIFLFRDSLLWILYHTNRGSNYLRVLAPFFVLFYIEAPMQSFLQATNKASNCMMITLGAMLFKLFSMGLFAFFKLGMYALVLAEIIDIILVVWWCFKTIKKELTTL